MLGYRADEIDMTGRNDEWMRKWMKTIDGRTQGRTNKGKNERRSRWMNTEMNEYRDERIQGLSTGWMNTGMNEHWDEWVQLWMHPEMKQYRSGRTTVGVHSMYSIATSSGSDIIPWCYRWQWAIPGDVVGEVAICGGDPCSECNQVGGGLLDEWTRGCLGTERTK